MNNYSLANVLADTLNPALTNQSMRQLAQLKLQKGFSIQLLVIADDGNNVISLRQSALIYLKNMV
jgi:hypothetical protein